jgi:hypothetical protein
MKNLCVLALKGLRGGFGEGAGCDLRDRQPVIDDRPRIKQKAPQITLKGYF